MPLTTWWGFAFTCVLMVVGAWIFRQGVLKGGFKRIEDFRTWTTWTAFIAAILVLLSSTPLTTYIEDSARIKDVSLVASVLGPLVLSVSVTLASIFYSAGEWYETSQRFRRLGVEDAKPNRQGRQSERGRFWQDKLRSTKKRIVISGTTLGGWFVNGWEETRESLLTILAQRVKVQVLLADPRGQGFALRAEDPAEAAEAEKEENARARAKRVYDRIGKLFNDDQFSPHIASGSLSFHVYTMTPLSVVWVDSQIYFATYLPFVSDKSCPEFSIKHAGEMGVTIANAIEELLARSEKIQTSEHAADLAAQCDQRQLAIEFKQ